MWHLCCSCTKADLSFPHSNSNKHQGEKMALADQTYGFFIPTVSLMGVGSSKEAGEQAKALGAQKRYW